MTNQEKLESFLKDLFELCIKHKATITTCGGAEYVYGVIDDNIEYYNLDVDTKLADALLR